MDYKNQVQKKITESSARIDERTDLWNGICASYERGGISQVEESLSEKMEIMKIRFDEIINKIEQML